MNNGAPFDSSANLLPRKQKSSKSSESHPKKRKDRERESISHLQHLPRKDPNNHKIYLKEKKTFITAIKSNCQGWINGVKGNMLHNTAETIWITNGINEKGERKEKGMNSNRNEIEVSRKKKNSLTYCGKMKCRRLHYFYQYQLPEETNIQH